METVQQGDILFKPVSQIPEGAVRVPREAGKLILAHGESGHIHAIVDKDADLWMLTRNGITEFYVEVSAPKVTVVHDTHKPLTLTQGVAQVDRVRELDFFEGYARKVID